MSSILLRPWDASDATDLSAVYSTTPDLTTQLGGAVLDNAGTAAEFIETRLVWAPDSAFNFAIEVEGQAVGNVGISNFDRRHSTAWMYYWLARGSRGLGLGSRAAAGISQWAIHDLEIFRLELGHRVNNPASCRVAVNAGFIPEGVERAKLQYGHERFDVETHARLATDPTPALEPIPIITAD